MAYFYGIRVLHNSFIRLLPIEKSANKKNFSIGFFQTWYWHMSQTCYNKCKWHMSFIFP